MSWRNPVLWWYMEYHEEYTMCTYIYSNPHKETGEYIITLLVGFCVSIFGGWLYTSIYIFINTHTYGFKVDRSILFSNICIYKNILGPTTGLLIKIINHTSKWFCLKKSRNTPKNFLCRYVQPHLRHTSNLEIHFLRTKPQHDSLGDPNWQNVDLKNSTAITPHFDSWKNQDLSQVSWPQRVCWLHVSRSQLICAFNHGRNGIMVSWWYSS